MRYYEVEEKAFFNRLSLRHRKDFAIIEELPNCKIYLPFQNNALDVTVNKNHGTVSGAVLAAGKYGKGYSFDGIDDNINCGNGAGLQITNTITISLWANINITQLMNGGLGYIISKTYGTLASGGFGILFDDRGGANGTNCIKFFVIASDQSFGQCQTADNIIPSTGWYHIAGTYDKDAGGTTEAKLYINGVSSATADFSKAIATNSIPLAIGANNKSNSPFYQNFFQGTIDEVIIFNVALSASNVNRLMNGLHPIL